MALWWLIGSPVIFSPVIPASTLPDINQRVLAMILSVFILILLAPAATRLSTIKKWFCWTDALNEKQKKALFTGSIKEHRMHGCDGLYFSRVKPYIFRFILSSWAVMIISLALLSDGETSPSLLFVIASLLQGAFFYLSGVTILILALIPIYKGRAEFGKKP